MAKGVKILDVTLGFVKKPPGPMQSSRTLSSPISILGASNTLLSCVAFHGATRLQSFSHMETFGHRTNINDV